MGKKYSIDSDYFKRWTPEMAYVLGFFFADGSMEYSPAIRGVYIRFSSTDKEIITAIKHVLKSEHSIVVTKASSHSKRSYLLRIGDRTCFDDLTNLGLHPNKSKTVRFPDLPHKYLPEFVRGYFDGDGCVFLERMIRKTDSKQVIKRLHTSFTCGSKKFLENLNTHLRDRIGINSKIYMNTRSFQLRYSTQSSIALFKVMYGTPHVLKLDRKYNRFREFFIEKEDWLDLEIKHILKRH